MIGKFNNRSEWNCFSTSSNNRRNKQTIPILRNVFHLPNNHPNPLPKKLHQKQTTRSPSNPNRIRIPSLRQHPLHRINQPQPLLRPRQLPRTNRLHIYLTKFHPRPKK